MNRPDSRTLQPDKPPHAAPEQDPLELILHRHIFYLRRYRFMQAAFAAMLGALGIALGIFIHGITFERPPQYIVVSEENDTPILTEPLSIPQFPDVDVARWAQRRILDFYTMDYLTWRNDLIDFRRYVAEPTWRQVLADIELAGIRQSLVADQARFQAQVHPERSVWLRRADPSEYSARFFWEVIVPIRQTVNIRPATGSSTAIREVTYDREFFLTVVRASPTETPERLLILNMARCVGPCARDKSGWQELRLGSYGGTR